jgi:hypothetical protein
MQGRQIPAASVEELAKLPPIDILRGQVLAAIIAPLSAIAALINAPLQNLYGLLDARIEQLENQPGADSLGKTNDEPTSQSAPGGLAETSADPAASDDPNPETSHSGSAGTAEEA